MESPRASRKRILVVDDDPKTQRQLQEILEGEGYGVDLSSEGQDALIKVRSGDYALILLDAILPKLDGFRLARLLKFDAKTKAIPILMLTVLDRDADRQRSQAVGVEGYLIKPIAEANLLEEIRKQIR